MGELFIPMNPTDRDDEFGGIGKELGNHNIPCSNYHVADMGISIRALPTLKLANPYLTDPPPPRIDLLLVVLQFSPTYPSDPPN